MTLTIKKLTGGYTGITVIKDINLKIESGQVVGLIGLNGAGKSTTIKHLLGLLRMQRGEITLNGIDLVQNPAAFKKNVAYIPLPSSSITFLAVSSFSTKICCTRTLGWYSFQAFFS